MKGQFSNVPLKIKFNIEMTKYAIDFLHNADLNK